MQSRQCLYLGEAFPYDLITSLNIYQSFGSNSLYISCQSVSKSLVIHKIENCHQHFEVTRKHRVTTAGMSDIAAVVANLPANSF